MIYATHTLIHHILEVFNPWPPLYLFENLKHVLITTDSLAQLLPSQSIESLDGTFGQHNLYQKISSEIKIIVKVIDFSHYSESIDSIIKY